MMIVSKNGYQVQISDFGFNIFDWIFDLIFFFSFWRKSRIEDCREPDFFDVVLKYVFKSRFCRLPEGLTQKSIIKEQGGLLLSYVLQANRSVQHFPRPVAFDGHPRALLSE